jgi:hypothetical protein
MIDLDKSCHNYALSCTTLSELTCSARWQMELRDQLPEAGAGRH